ncbi:hypothetical protein VCHA37P193_80201 [Vibrio chagasii]|nr:hypothetical protein VCHA37P193_80201 [Vibrio chagasii]CAH7425466.1 hypothetical protein VCHA43P284_90199 [Vibrio chagasii]
MVISPNVLRYFGLLLILKDIKTFRQKAESRKQIGWVSSLVSNSAVIA